MRIGILTGGGDCPGLNAVIRAVGRRAFTRGWEALGVREGWRGLVEGIFMPLGPREISGILPRGGTILGTTRTNPYKVEGGVDKVLQNFAGAGLDALVAIGGEDTLGVAARLFAERQFPVVGVPKTIDNDLSSTDYTFGFDTAVWIATEAIDRLHTTAESHNRVMVVEVMGRHTGWIAVMSGIAGGADVILIPELPISLDEACDDIRRRHERGKDFSIVVVSEGYELEGGRDMGELGPCGPVALSGRGVRRISTATSSGCSSKNARTGSGPGRFGVRSSFTSSAPGASRSTTSGVSSMSPASKNKKSNGACDGRSQRQSPTRSSTFARPSSRTRAISAR